MSELSLSDIVSDIGAQDLRAQYQAHNRTTGFLHDSLNTNSPHLIAILNTVNQVGTVVEPFDPSLGFDLRRPFSEAFVTGAGLLTTRLLIQYRGAPNDFADVARSTEVTATRLEVRNFVDPNRDTDSRARYHDRAQRLHWIMVIGVLLLLKESVMERWLNLSQTLI